MTVRPTVRDTGSLVRIAALSAAAAAALVSAMPRAFAQASEPVTSSVFVHRAYDTGNGAINDNFQYIAHPPIRPVAASAPPVARGAHRGRRGQTGTTNSAGATGSGSNSAAIPLPTMPADGSSGTPVSQ
ncbi:hypothetical protein BLA23254_06562 [Burkholderia lata]|uniref:Lipoprotein n=1 Tax=Burkholderia lata (strain ATCC 17760 / DSM 23089 / LMG 22485 / NCIMB 9086 / R18194 / 383) TaxID=482957 RepID=A0A6P2RNH3_BURL3|nr:hypothetical protein [Burkholderia lata]VWC34704.1 hypothetical protein BLA23254_06562 [Burkholderia lata]